MAEQISDRHVDWRNNSASATTLSNSSDTNEYLLRTTHLLRDDLPRSKELHILENRNYPIIRTDSPLFDAIYAMSINEVEENAVEEVRDSSFSTEPCHCFETGRKWSYVWTRDISYAAHLALGGLNQGRTKNTLLFKISKRRNQSEDTVEIIQDTGNGGSWPLSTDRVVWAMAAWELLHHLEGQERSIFLQTSYRAILNSIENDLIAAFDPNDGLYTGEQSFLDWREQTYPRWVADNVVHIGMSKSLSTNVAHYMALKTLSLMALELRRATDHQRYQKLASELAGKINTHFWDNEKGLYRTYLITYLDRAAVDKYDLLGNALAVLSGVRQTEEQKNC
ncbi:MAG: esterase, partial [Bdellovibrionota bacterium]